MLPIGLQLYSVRNEMEKDFAGTLKRVAEMGYDGVEFAGLFGHSASEIKALLEKNGLAAVSAHVPLAEMLEDMDKVIATYKEIGCKYIAIPYVEEKYRPGRPDYGETLATIAQLGKKCSENGIVLMYHNHDFEFVKVDGKYGLDIMYETVPAEYLQTELDTCWVNVGGEDPAKYVEKYSGRAPVVHLKDFHMSGKGKPAKLYQLIGIDDGAQDAEQEEEAFGFRPCGYGVQNFPEILEACKKAGTSWVVVEQDQPSLGKTPLECAKMSIDYIKEINK